MASISGTRVNPETGEALNPEQQGLLDSQNESEEYEGLSPLAMGLLQAGASMMRSGGWRNRPMTTSEAIGHAIPEGIRGYYNQDMMNQQEEAEFYARQQAEEQAQQTEDQLLREQKQEQLQIQQAIDALELIDDTVINRGTKRMLKEMLRRGGKTAQDAMTKIVELTSAKEEAKEEKAGKVFKHPELGIWGQFNKDGIWETIEIPEADVAGFPVGLFTIGSEKAKKVLARQQIKNADLPEGTKFIDVKPIGFNGIDSGVSIAFLNKNNEQILTEEDKETQSDP